MNPPRLFRLDWEEQIGWVIWVIDNVIYVERVPFSQMI